MNMPEGGIKEVSKNICQLCYSAVGTVALFSTAIYISNHTKVPHWVVSIGSSCFGVYIFQQFILMFIYYKTDVPQIVHPYIMPWLAFLIALSVSLCCSVLIRKTKLGRSII